MDVNHERIIQKMIDELQTARQDNTDQTIARHAANVRVLADLLVENAQGSSADMKAQNLQQFIQPSQQHVHPQHNSDIESPDSIFDF